MSAATDDELMLAVQHGEIERLGELFERHHRRVYALFVRLTGDRAASEDLVQEMFVRMLKYRDTFRADAAFLPWMYAMVRNVAADFRRGGIRRGREVSVAVEPLDDAPTPPEQIEHDQTRQRLDVALARLSPEMREILTLVRFAELKYAEIGSIVGLSAGAVKVRIHRALTALRESVAAEAGECGR